jgi:hypothetical protein
LTSAITLLIREIRQRESGQHHKQPGAGEFLGNDPWISAALLLPDADIPDGHGAETREFATLLMPRVITTFSFGTLLQYPGIT